jgi:hypothetical protein
LNANNKPCDQARNELVFAKGEVDTSVSNSGYLDPNESLKNDLEQLELETWILNAIEERIHKNNALVACRMVRKTSKKAQIFKEGWIVTVAIPLKLRRSVEPKRLLVWILSINNHSHMLMSRFGRIKGAFQPRQLNTVESNTLGLDIPIGWPENGPKILLT